MPRRNTGHYASPPIARLAGLVLVGIAAIAIVAIAVRSPRRTGEPQSARPILSPGPPLDSTFTAGEAAPLADSVRAAFVHAWRGYARYAWGHDRLMPMRHDYEDWYGEPLLMTPVDAYDTMLLMGLDSLAARDKALILSRLSFDRDESVEVFEVTIRLLGGLLSGYELNHDPRFLRLAASLGERLLPAFDSPTGMPYRFVNLKTGQTRDPDSNPAEIGSLTLEFGTLSRLTGRPVFYAKAKRAVTALFQHRSAIGLVGTTINVRTGKWVNTEAGIGGGIDSYYEYLLKAWLLFGDQDFHRMWLASIGPVNRYLADTRFGGLWYGQADMNTGERTTTHFGALDAFFPAVLCLSGDTARAERLMKSVYRMWTTFDVEPESMDYSDMRLIDHRYLLRPEALESTYYLWHFTHDPRYRAAGRDLFDRLLRWTRVPAGFTALLNVRTKTYYNIMPSYFLAETLKYAYLLFAPPGTLDFDHVIFNTEGHPLRRFTAVPRAQGSPSARPR